MNPSSPSSRHGLVGRLAAATLAWVACAAAAQVGMTTLPDRDLPITLVYPTTEAARPVSLGPFELRVAMDALPAPGRRRLVVMSHGTGGSPLADHALAATLARAGFVVAQPLHAGDHFRDTSASGPESWARRPGEISRVIDRLSRDPPWKDRLALDRVGVHGMSAGGVTALALAGAQWRLLDLVRHCQAHADDDFGFCFNGLPDAAAQAARRERYDSARGVPEWLLPKDLKAVHGGKAPAQAGEDVRPDPRIAAATVAVPVVAPFSAESLARIAVPVGVVSAGRDTMLLPRFHADRLLANCRRCTLLADLRDAAHLDLLAPWPAEVASSVAATQPRGAATTPGFDGRPRDAAFEAIAAFYRRELER